MTQKIKYVFTILVSITLVISTSFNNAYSGNFSGNIDFYTNGTSASPVSGNITFQASTSFQYIKVLYPSDLIYTGTVSVSSSVISNIIWGNGSGIITLSTVKPAGLYTISNLSATATATGNKQTIIKTSLTNLFDDNHGVDTFMTYIGTNSINNTTQSISTSTLGNIDISATVGAKPQIVYACQRSTLFMNTMPNSTTCAILATGSTVMTYNLSIPANSNISGSSLNTYSGNINEGTVFYFTYNKPSSYTFVPTVDKIDIQIDNGGYSTTGSISIIISTL